MKPEASLVIERYCGVYNIFKIENGQGKEYFLTRASDLYRLIDQFKQKYQCIVSFKGFKNEGAHMDYIKCLVERN